MNVLALYALKSDERRLYEAIEGAGDDGLTKRDMTDRCPGLDVEKELKSLLALGHVGRIGTTHRYGVGVKSGGGRK